jgi:hypothetical protein
MEEYFMAVNPALWNLVNRGITFQVEMLLWHKRMKSNATIKLFASSTAL